MLQLIPMILAFWIAVGFGTLIEWCRNLIAYVRVRRLRLTRTPEPEPKENDDDDS